MTHFVFMLFMAYEINILQKIGKNVQWTELYELWELYLPVESNVII